MQSKTFLISGIVKLTLSDDTINISNYEVEAFSQKQALYKLAIDVASKRGMNRKYIFQRILRSHLVVKQLKGGL